MICSALALPLRHQPRSRALPRLPHAGSGRGSGVTSRRVQATSARVGRGRPCPSTCPQDAFTAPTVAPGPASEKPLRLTCPRAMSEGADGAAGVGTLAREVAVSLPPAQAVAGVICDLDGTLVDSEYLAPLAWAAVLREVGADVPEGEEGVEAVAKHISTPSLRGAAALDIAKFLSTTYSVDAAAHAPAWMAQRKRAVAVEQALSGDHDFSTLWYPGVPEALARATAALGGGAALGLCTSNLRPVVEATLAGAGLANAFGGGRTVQEDVFDSEGAPQLKPDPTPYQRALRLMGRPPSQVVAIEDSVVGVTAASRAGVGLVLGVLNGEDDGEEAAAALRAAGAGGVFPSTPAALEWCAANAAPPAEAELADAAVCAAKEAVVRRYFAGVNTQDPVAIASCFADEVTLRDMCGISKGAPRIAKSSDMAERCMDFLTAHPDCNVFFESPPMADREGRWVWAHWAETGTWKGASCGLEPQGTPLDVSGHTRFLLEEIDGEYKIVKQVVYRTFSDWELALQ